MKRIFFSCLLMVFASCFAIAQSAQSDLGPKINWEKATHDFGDIYQGDKVEYTYKFTNTGTEPLVITNVTVTCGCTLPKAWPHDPILPGGNGEITVAFNSAGKMGKQGKVVTIVSNAVNTEATQVSFSTNVIEKKVIN